jgi:prevent-host-death family protein
VPVWASTELGPIGFKDSTNRDYPVSVTRIGSKAKKANKTNTHGDQPTARWRLQDAKARFSELVRRVRRDGPQHVTIHGRDAVVIVAAEEFRRLKGSLTGATLIEALQASPFRDVDIEPEREPMPVRDIHL